MMRVNENARNLNYSRGKFGNFYLHLSRINFGVFTRIETLPPLVQMGKEKHADIKKRNPKMKLWPISLKKN